VASYYIPDPVITLHDGIAVVRDDLLEGGTKLRLATALFEAYPHINEWCYGGGVAFGYAQIALAIACKEHGKKFTMWLARRKELHPYTKKAVEEGANLIEVKMGMLTVTKARAREYAAEKKDRMEIPMGLDVPVCIEELERVARSLHYHPKEVWTVAASGTLTRGLQRAWPDAKFYAVQVGHKLTQEEVGRAELLVSPLKFQQYPKKQDMPPFPCVANYEGKAWKFIKERASEGALFWNVGGYED
jgi:hypothetical protein